MSRFQRFHLPDPDGAFDPCDEPDCAAEHQVIQVKGHGGRRYQVACIHARVGVFEHDLTRTDFDPATHLRTVAKLISCDDPMTEIPEA